MTGECTSETHSLYDFYNSRCTSFKNNILFDNALTYGETLTLVRSRAAWLQDKGFGKNDVIALLSANSREWCITYMAVTSIGAIVFPLDINYQEGSYDPILDAAGAAAVFVSGEFRGRIKNHRLLDLSPLECIADPDSFIPPQVKGDDIASLVFTSGTTGSPRMVMLTQANIFKTAVACADFVGTRPTDCILCLLPLFHVYALTASFMGPMAHGSAIHIQPSLKGPDIIKSLRDFPISFFPATPQLWEMIFDAISGKVKSESKTKHRIFIFFARNGHIIRAMGLGFIVNMLFKPVRDTLGIDHHLCFVSGGAALKKQYAGYYKNMGFRLIEGYGLSETTGPVCVDNWRNIRIGSIGRPLSGNEAIVRNVNSDGIGEVWVRGCAVSPGYYKNPGATGESFDSEGFFNTGDLGRIDKKGYVYLTGRSKNVIVLDSGKNVYPEELEIFYRQSELIQEIAVIGRKINGRLEVFAVIVPRDKKPESFNVIREELKRLNAELPDYKKVNHFALSWDPLPVNTIRKVLYREVIVLLEQGAYQTHENDTVKLRTELAASGTRQEIIISILKKKLNSKILFARQTLSDFHIDSLGLIDLIVHLEESLSITIDIDRLRSLSTLDEIVLFLETCEKNTGPSLDDRILRSKITTRPYIMFTPMNHLLMDFLYLVSRIWNLRLINPGNLIVNNTILAANHESFLDMMWVAVSIPRRLRKDVYVISKRKMKFAKYLLPFIPVIFIEEENPFPSLKAGADLLRQGKTMVIFPEGTRCADGKPGEFKNGAAYLAKNLGIKIIPLSINGAYEIYPRQKLIPDFFRGKKGSITVGEILDPADYDTVDELNSAIREAIISGLE